MRPSRPKLPLQQLGWGAHARRGYRNQHSHVTFIYYPALRDSHSCSLTFHSAGESATRLDPTSGLAPPSPSRSRPSGSSSAQVVSVYSPPNCRRQSRLPGTSYPDRLMQRKELPRNYQCLEWLHGHMAAVLPPTLVASLRRTVDVEGEGLHPDDPLVCSQSRRRISKR